MSPEHSEPSSRQLRRSKASGASDIMAGASVEVRVLAEQEPQVPNYVGGIVGNDLIENNGDGED